MCARRCAAGLNLTEAANALHTSQPGVSKQIRELRRSSFDIFVRRGKRMSPRSPNRGRRCSASSSACCREADNLKRAARDFSDQDAGRFTIATTHTQARYALPRVVGEFKRRYPKVHPDAAAGQPAAARRDGAGRRGRHRIATEALDDFPGLLACPDTPGTIARWFRPGTPCSRPERSRWRRWPKYPIVTYDAAFAGRTHIDAAFAARGIAVDVVLSAIDADVIKTYVELGPGRGHHRRHGLRRKARSEAARASSARTCFHSNTTRVAVKRGSLLRGYAYEFIELFAPALNRKLIERALAGEGELYEL